MEFCHTNSFSDSPMVKEISEFVQEQRKKWATQEDLSSVAGFEIFEQEIHRLVMALERAIVSEELSRYDIYAPEIEVNGERYERGIRSPEHYLTAAGRVEIERYLYHPLAEKGKSICPLEYRSGIVAGYFTPRAARQGAYAMAHLTPGESEALFAEIGNMQPSRSSLDRLTKTLSPHWEAHRESWEAILREGEAIPATATVMTISVDGVMAPMRDAELAEKAEPSDKQASGPKGYKEVGCGTITLYDQTSERLQTVRYARMPESRKVTLQQQLQTECAAILAIKPGLLRVHLADGAKENWRLLKDIEAALPASSQTPVEIVDFFHACDHLKRGCDGAWGDNTPQSTAFFERLRTTLKEKDDGAERVIRTLRFQHSQASGNRRKRLETELTYFRNQQPRMHYAEYIRQGLPIASGVMEAACKTLVTQRLKRSGMVWTLPGGQAILTLRSLIQSNRWPSAWSLLHTDFCIPVTVPDPSAHLPVQPFDIDLLPSAPLPIPAQPVGLFDYAAMLLAC